MTLYELTQDALALKELLDSGEITDEIFNDTLEAMEIDTKVENVCKMIRIFEAKAEVCKKEKDRLAANEKAATNAVKRLKDSLTNYMQTTQKKKIEAGTFTVTQCSSQSLEILYEDMIDEEFLIPQPCKIDKTGITKAIKEGREIAGAVLVDNPYIRIR